MSVLDIFAWIVLVVLVATPVAVVVALGMLPGMIAQQAQPSLGAGRRRSAAGSR